MLGTKERLSSDVLVNTRGLPALASELYLEILSHLPTIPIPQDVWIDKRPDPYRQLTLFSLSQTCQSLRGFFLRYAWERIEVFGGMWTPLGRLDTKGERNELDPDMKELGDQMLVRETLRQFETVAVRNPDLRQCVSIVNLTVLGHSHESVIPKIAQGLSLLPNLHTLQLVYHFYYPLGPPLQIFSAFRYPNVHTLNLSRLSADVDVIRACPNVRHFSFYKDVGDPFEIENLFANECAASINKLGVRLISLQSHIAVIGKSLPRLCDISLDCQNMRSGANFDPLSSLPLHTIRLRLDDWLQSFYSRFTPASQDERQRWLLLAKGILAKCPQDDVAKKVIVVNYDNTVEVHECVSARPPTKVVCR